MRHTLRESTQAIHQEFDDAFRALNISDISSVTRFVISQALAFADLERYAEKHGITRILADWSVRRRTEQFASVLAAVSDEAMTSRQSTLDPSPSLSYLMGLLYVLEGSRLGGNYLRKQFFQAEDPTIKSFASCFVCDPKFWTSFLARLEKDAGHLLEEQCAQGARDAFGVFKFYAENFWWSAAKC